MRKLLIAFSAMCFLVLAGPAQAETRVFNAERVPWRIQTNVCFGGQICGANDYVQVHFTTLYNFVSTIRVYAHDQVGSVSKANLVVYVDSVPIGRYDVKYYGSWISIQVNRHATDIRFTSVHEDGFSTEETVIRTIELS